MTAFTPRYYQTDAVDAVFEYYARHGGKVAADGLTPVQANPVIVMPTGCHAAGARILMHDGTTKLVQDVQLGDKLMGPDSTPRHVLQLARGNETLYRITPTKGEPFVVNEGHKLSLALTNEGKPQFACYKTGTEIETVCLRDWLAASKNFKHLRKLRRVAVNFPVAPMPLIPAWHMGVLLGDGSLKTGAGITCENNHIADYIIELAELFGLETRYDHKTDNKAFTIRFVQRNWTRSTPNPLVSHLKVLGLAGCCSGSKFVPDVYKRGSRQTRLEVLAGLLDTDGSLSCNGYDYLSKSQRLADDVVFIARSVGLAAYATPCQKQCQTGGGGEYFRVSITGDVTSIPVRLPYKKAAPRLQKKSPLKTSFTADAVGRGDFYGFALDGDNLYLTDDFIVHHNTGKSNVIALLIERIIRLYPRQRFLMLVHVKELVEQNYHELRHLWPQAPVGIYSAGMRRADTAHQIVFGGIASVANNIEAFGWRDIIIVDECHLLSPADGTLYQSVITKLLSVNPWLRVIGLSATPYRLGLGMITDNGVFTDICFDISGVNAFRRLIGEGYLSTLIAKRTRTELDVSEVGIEGGDYVKAQLQEAVDKDDINRAALAELCEYGQGRQSWLVFASGIAHAEHCADILNSYGVPTAAIHSKLKGKLRDERIAAFKAGRLRAITGNGIFTTGFNHPPVDLIGMLRPTTSVGLHVQMLGRGTRPFSGNSTFHPKENCMVLDFALNTRRLGPIDDPMIPRKKGKGTGDPPCCICEACGSYNHARAIICVVCGADIEHASKLIASAAIDEPLTSDLPVYEWFPVFVMRAVEHTKPGAPPSLRVTYTCGLRAFNEWIHLERTGYAGKSARDWWRRFSLDEPPVTVAQALQEFSRLRQPKHIKVWLNRKYPEVVDYSFAEQPAVKETV